ncbi:MAG: hypothetical protein M1118_10995 [Chloroflexi bacterium]|nr:hypothetical protein [Chloroflexota bacterium]
MEREDIELGENITALVGKQRSGTVVLSVRLTSRELGQVETLADRRRCTMSDVVRDAIRGYVRTHSVEWLVATGKDLNFSAPDAPVVTALGTPAEVQFQSGAAEQRTEMAQVPSPA